MKKCIILIISLLMLSACNKTVNIQTDYTSCDLKVDSLSEYKKKIENEEFDKEVLISGAFYYDEEINDDNILIDVLSSSSNNVITINGGYSYSDDSIKYYSPIKSLKIKNSGTYCISIQNIDGEFDSWVSIPICLENGKHYMIFSLRYDELLNLLEEK